MAHEHDHVHDENCNHDHSDHGHHHGHHHESASTVTKVDDVTVEVDIQIPWDHAKLHIDQTLQRMQRTAHIKGFRPGKAPKAMIQQLYGKNAKAEVLSQLMEESLMEAVQKHQLPVVSAANLVAQPTLEDGKEIDFKVRFEVRPTILNLKTDLSVEHPRFTVEESDIEKTIEGLRRKHAVLEPAPEGTVSAAGHVLSVSFTVTVDGTLRNELTETDRELEIGDNSVLAELDAALTGMKAGESKSLTVTRPADDSNKELAGKTVVFELSVKEIRSRVLPNLDDEFAKDVGEFKTLAELKTDVRNKLETEMARNKERTVRQAVIDAFTEANPIPVPQSLVAQQLKSMAEEYIQFSQMLRQDPSVSPELIERFKSESEKKVRAALLLGELSRKESISTSDSDIDDHLQKMAEASGKNIAKLRAEHRGERREALETQILERKLIDHLISRAVLKETSKAASE